MRLTKEIADKVARHFRAELNKSAKDGLAHVCHYALSNGTVISFEVSVGKGEIRKFGEGDSDGAT